VIDYRLHHAISRRPCQLEVRAGSGIDLFLFIGAGK
jgi:hypothetical protein